MIIKEITYTDYNGDERTESFYFNISKSEVIKMQMSHPGGYAEYLERIVKAKDQVSLIEAFTVFIRDSYGEKTEDGRRFVKSKELSDAFLQTEAYDVLFMELVNDPNKAAEFIRGILPNVEIDEAKKDELLEKTQALIDSKKQ